MRVLISAYACEPGAGSEPGAGWEWTKAAAAGNEVWLLTRANNAKGVDREIAAGGLTIMPVYLDLPKWARWWKRRLRGVRLYYVIWQVLAWRAARRLHAEKRFDVIHHLTFASDSMPAGVAFVPDARVVWGPVGGACRMPRSVWRWLGFRGQISEAVRGLVTVVLRRLFGDAVARRSDVVVAQNPGVARRFGRMSVIEPNVVVDRIPSADARVPRSNAPDTIRQTKRTAAFVGRLVPWKGLRLAIATIALADHWRLVVIGDGPELERCKQIASRLGVEDRIEFLGARPRDEVLFLMKDVDVLLHPSFHDAAGWVVAEALSVGTPVVCLDLGGPPYLTGGCGVVVPPTGDLPDALALALDDALGRPTDTGRWSSSRLPAVVAAWYGTSDTIRLS